MLFSFTARIVSALAAFIYPGYASYKTLSQRPASEEELERWLMYWSVLGCTVGVEYIAEWLVSWIPFYSSLKALFLLYLALPQTQGSTYIYLVHLRPFLAAHERTIDSAIAEVRARLYRLVQEKAQAVWGALVASLAPGGGGGAAAAAAAGTTPAEQPPAPTPAGPTQLLSSLWTSYGPGILAGGAALLRQTATATLPGSSSARGPSSNANASNTFTTPHTSAFFSSTNPNPNAHSAVPVDPAERRRQLEAELAALASLPAMPTPPANNPARGSVSSFASSSSSGSLGALRDRTMSSGRFEEIKGGDVDGYEVDDGEEGEGQGEDFVGGFVKQGQGSGKGTSWFGGWGSGGAGGGGSRGGYERVKSD